MHLKQSKYKNGRTYISIVESYRGEDKKPRVRTVKTFGYLDELVETYGESALDKCKEICDEMTKQAKENKKAKLDRASAIAKAEDLVRRPGLYNKVAT